MSNNKFKAAGRFVKLMPIHAANDGTTVVSIFGKTTGHAPFETGLREGISLTIDADNHEELIELNNIEIMEGAIDWQSENLAFTYRPFFANNTDRQYLLEAERILREGKASENRTNTNTSKLFGTQLEFDLREGLPLLTSKKLNTGAIRKELCWFLRGETNTKTLGSKIWDEWATEDGELGPVYGKQWRGWTCWHQVNEDTQPERLQFLLDQGYTRSQRTEQFVMLFKHVDQLQDLVDELENNPNNRRMIVTAWNPADNPDTRWTPSENAAFGMQALPPCHTMWQVACADMTEEERVIALVQQRGWTVHEAEEHMNAFLDTNPTVDREDWLNNEGAPKHFLDLQLYQRSADWFLGVPFNIASYAMLTELLAHHTNKIARRFIHTFGDYHIYDNHVEQLREQINRRETYQLPKLVISNKRERIQDYTHEDLCIVDYEHGPELKGKVAV
jgi:thymidylate synthase